MKKFFCLFLIFLFMFLMCSCIAYSPFEEMADNLTEPTTDYEYVTQASQEIFTQVYVENTTLQTAENTTAAEATTAYLVIPESTTFETVTYPQENTTVPVIIPEETTASVLSPEKDYTSYSKKEILDEYEAALKKTRAYKGSLTVNHTESFVADVRDAYPGGALTDLLASNIVKLVGSEGQQTLNFNNGNAVNADGETVPVLLPQRTAYSLPPEGVSSASIEKSGDRIHIRIVLVPETVSMGEVPQYNSKAIGYLDTSDMDFKIITISRVDITYPGSVIDAYIRDDGFVDSVTYTINMSTYAELSGMGITGYGTLEGAQTEKWQINY